MKTNSSPPPPPKALSRQENLPGQGNIVTLRSPDNGNGALIAEIDPKRAFCRSLKLTADSANESREIEFFSYQDEIGEEFATLSGQEANFSLAGSRHWWDGMACPPISWALTHHHNHNSRKTTPSNNSSLSSPPNHSNIGGGSSLILTGELHQANNGDRNTSNTPNTPKQSATAASPANIPKITLERSITLNWQREMVIRQTLCANADPLKIEIMEGLALPVSLSAYERWTTQTVPDFLNVKYLENISIGGDNTEIYAGSATPRALTLLEEGHEAKLDKAIGVEPYEMLHLLRNDWGRSTLPTGGGGDDDACPYGLRVLSNALHLIWQLARVKDQAYLFFDIQSFPVRRRVIGNKHSEQTTFPPRIYGQLRQNQAYQTTTLYQFI